MTVHMCSNSCMCFATGCTCEHCAPIVTIIDQRITDERKTHTMLRVLVYPKQWPSAPARLYIAETMIVEGCFLVMHRATDITGYTDGDDEENVPRTIYISSHMISLVTREETNGKD
jgi:hypothetical protein